MKQICQTQNNNAVCILEPNEVKALQERRNRLENFMSGQENENDGLVTLLSFLPDALYELRKEQGLTLKDVSSKGGISISFLSDIERGKTRPSLATLEKLAIAYQKTITIDIGYAAEGK